MTPELAIWASLLGGPAAAQPAPEPVPDEVPPEAAPVEPVPVESAPEAAPVEVDPGPEEMPEDPLARYRTRFDVLAERAIGTTSRPVEFNWRQTSAHLAVSGSFLFELNNFNSVRGGAMVRLPTGGALFEFGLSYVGVWDTPSSELLALTPYRQPGRPERLELDVTLALPLAEGVVTAFPRFFPAVEMVFNLYGGFRYTFYPTGWGGLTAGEVGAAIFAPALSEAEVQNLEGARLAAMQVDPGRYGLMFGFGNDLYFQPGLFLSPRLLLAAPLLAPATETDLLMWADLSLAIGVAL